MALGFIAAQSGGRFAEGDGAVGAFRDQYAPTFSLPTDIVTVGFNAFAGGGSAAYAPKNDSWARHDNVRIWSGTVAGG